MAFLTLEDLRPFANIPPDRAMAMITDAEADAAIVAPCLSLPTFAAQPRLVAALRAVLRQAVLRWHEAGSGAVQQTSIGPFSESVDTRLPRRGMFWPSEIERLQELCAQLNGTGSAGGYTVDTAGTAVVAHMPWCALMWQATYCSCVPR